LKTREGAEPQNFSEDQRTCMVL